VPRNGEVVLPNVVGLWWAHAHLRSVGLGVLATRHRLAPGRARLGALRPVRLRPDLAVLCWRHRLLLQPCFNLRHIEKHLFAGDPDEWDSPLRAPRSHGPWPERVALTKLMNIDELWVRHRAILLGCLLSFTVVNHQLLDTNIRPGWRSITRSITGTQARRREGEPPSRYRS